jgi:hypothetical protein
MKTENLLKMKITQGISEEVGYRLLYLLRKIDDICKGNTKDIVVNALLNKFCIILKENNVGENEAVEFFSEFYMNFLKENER